MQKVNDSRPDHLFVSYAVEDGVFTRWLTLRLTAEGYRVWCYETELLGGEIYPRNIRKAINESTFRMLAVISKSSIDKEHPLQERMLGEGVGSSLGIEDFVIPLNLDGTKREDLDLHTSAALYIPFYKGWAAGLSQLLEKLEKVSAPKAQPTGKQAVVAWIDSQQKFVKSEQERVWSNVIAITNFPRTLKRYNVTNIPDPVEDRWPTYAKSRDEVWAFGPPGKGAALVARQTGTVDWTKELYADDMDSFYVATAVLREAIESYCVQRGLRFSDDHEDIYFPFKLLPKDKLTYRRYDGKKVPVNVVGRKTIRRRTGEKQISWYHIAPVFQPIMNRFGDPCYQLNFRLVWTDREGVEEKVPTGRRRLKWYNYQWLARSFAVLSWLTDGKESLDVRVADDYNITISGKLLDVSSREHIDEEALGEKPEEDDDENEVIEDEPEIEENNEEPQAQVKDIVEPD